MNERTYSVQAVRLGEQLRSRRRALRLTQEELAVLADTTQHTVSMLETGKRTSRLDILVAVAEALGLELVAVNHGTLPTLCDTDEPAT